MLKAGGLEYEALGHGEAVLLIHGGIFAGAFVPLTREASLADRYRLVRYHRRGFADSDGLAGPFSIADQARDALALLTHLRITRAHVVGHSYGGVIALQLALDAVDVVRSLVLIEPAIYGMNPRWRAAQVDVFAPLVDLYRAGEAAVAVDLFMRGAEGLDWRTGVETACPGGVEQAENDVATLFDAELPALDAWGFDSTVAARIGQPVLYVTGGEIRRPVEAVAEFFCSCVPQTERVVIPAADHSLHHREPTLVAAEIAGFLARSGG